MQSLKSQLKCQKKSPLTKGISDDQKQNHLLKLNLRTKPPAMNAIYP